MDEGNNMEKGTVKWFNNSKGYGFIFNDHHSEDIFVHHSNINMKGFRTLKTGQPVLFDAISGPSRLHATSIKLLDNENTQH